MSRRTVVVEGPLAFGMKRVAAARSMEAGLRIMTLPQLAARLAGGGSCDRHGRKISSQQSAVRSKQAASHRPFASGKRDTAYAPRRF